MVFTCGGEGEGFLTAVAEFSDLVGRQSDTTKGKTRIFLPYDSEERRKIIFSSFQSRIIKTLCATLNLLQFLVLCINNQEKGLKVQMRSRRDMNSLSVKGQSPNHQDA